MDHVSRRAILGAVGSIAGIGSLGAISVGGTDHDEVPVVDQRDIPLAYTEAEILEHMASGGVGKDSIPSIDDPTFVSADDAPDQLDDGDPVFGVARGGEAKAYPQHILVWHEIVNDVIDGEPVAVTYCPLTGTPQGFVRGSWEFGVSGQLSNNNLVMFDRATETYWPQMLAWGIGGPHSDTFLEEFRVIWTTWARWKAEHPETLVLGEDTGHIRNYGQDPYGSYNPDGGYYTNDQIVWPTLHQDIRFQPKQVFLGARTDDGAIAVGKRRLANVQVVEGTVGAHQYVVVHDPRFDTGWFYRTDEPVEVEVAGDGVLVDGDGAFVPHDLPLEPVLTMDTMWFPWVAYYPETAVLGLPESTRTLGEDSEEDTVGADADESPDDDEREDSVKPDTEDGTGVDSGEPADVEPLPGFGAIAGIGGLTAAYVVARLFDGPDGDEESPPD